MEMHQKQQVQMQEHQRLRQWLELLVQLWVQKQKHQKWQHDLGRRRGRED
ncbi:hypothetical protein ACFFJ4_03750 [Xanthomonas dyei]|nr:hypothetical protein [Xanthomonas dyei]